MWIIEPYSVIFYVVTFYYKCKRHRNFRAYLQWLGKEHQNPRYENKFNRRAIEMVIYHDIRFLKLDQLVDSNTH